MVGARGGHEGLARWAALWRGARKLYKEMPREAWVLEGFAQEEAAKALIFMDAVRCPRRLIGRLPPPLVVASAVIAAGRPPAEPTLEGNPDSTDRPRGRSVRR